MSRYDPLRRAALRRERGRKADIRYLALRNRRTRRTTDKTHHKSFVNAQRQTKNASRENAWRFKTGNWTGPPPNWGFRRAAGSTADHIRMWSASFGRLSRDKGIQGGRFARDHRVGARRAIGHGALNTLQGSGWAAAGLVHNIGRMPIALAAVVCAGVTIAFSPAAIPVAAALIASRLIRHTLQFLARQEKQTRNRQGQLVPGPFRRFVRRLEHPNEALVELFQRQSVNRSTTRDHQWLIQNGWTDSNGQLTFDASETDHKRARLVEAARDKGLYGLDRAARGYAARALADMTNEGMNRARLGIYPSRQVLDAMNAFNEIDKRIQMDTGCNPREAAIITNNIFGFDVDAALRNISTGRPLTAAEQDLIIGIQTFNNQHNGHDIRNINWDMAASAAVIRNSGVSLIPGNRAVLTTAEGNELQNVFRFDYDGLRRLARTSSNFESSPRGEPLDRSTVMSERAAELLRDRTTRTRSTAEDFGIRV